MKQQYFIRRAAPSDLEEMSALYDDLCDHLEANGNPPGWKKGSYPVRETAAAAIAEGSMYLACRGERIAGSIILNSRPEEGYAGVDWGNNLDWDEVLVVYTLCVHPNYLGQGAGAALMDFACRLAAAQGKRALRLDVYAGNAPAIALYEGAGFALVDTVDLGYAEYGLDLYRLYQKLL